MELPPSTKQSTAGAHCPPSQTSLFQYGHIILFQSSLFRPRRYQRVSRSLPPRQHWGSVSPSPRRHQCVSRSFLRAACPSPRRVFRSLLSRLRPHQYGHSENLLAGVHGFTLIYHFARIERQTLRERRQSLYTNGEERYKRDNLVRLRVD